MKTQLSMIVLTAVLAGCQSTEPAPDPPVASAETAARVTPEEVQALNEALADERRAQTTYAAVMAEFGERRPFSNIIHAERRHEAAVAALMTERGLIVPPHVPEPVEVPATFAEACRMAVQAERDNIAIYDRWLEMDLDPEIRTTFEQLRWASAERHLPAFERHARGGRGHGRRGA